LRPNTNHRDLASSTFLQLSAWRCPPKAKVTRSNRVACAIFYGRFADNKIALNAGWDLEILKLELGELASIDVGIDLTLTGFSTGEIDVVLTSADDPDDEVIPAVPLTPRTKLGDLWILGDHRVGCGDGRDAEFLRQVVGPGGRVDAAFLDPPYNVRIGGHAVSAGSHLEFAMASGEMSEAEFRSFLADTLGAAASVSREGAVHFVCMDWRHLDDVSAVGRTIYGDRLNLCIWNKSNAGWDPSIDPSTNWSLCIGSERHHI